MNTEELLKQEVLSSKSYLRAAGEKNQFNLTSIFWRKKKNTTT